MQRYDSDEYLDDYEDFDDDTTGDDEDVDVTECPECGTEVYEDSVQCPVCGSYITHSTNVWRGRSLPWVVLGLLGIVAVIYVLTMTMW
jgi:hypothetical protein